MIDELKLRNNVAIMSKIKTIEISFSNRTLNFNNNSINMLIIVSRSFNDNRFKINLVIKIMFIKIINIHNSFVSIINSLIINKTTSNKSFRHIKSTTTTQTINTQTFAFCRRRKIDYRLQSTQQTTTRQIRINNNNDSRLNLLTKISFETTSTIIRRVFNQFIKSTFSKKLTKTLSYKR